MCKHLTDTSTDTGRVHLPVEGEVQVLQLCVHSKLRERAADAVAADIQEVNVWGQRWQIPADAVTRQVQV